MVHLGVQHPFGQGFLQIGEQTIRIESRLGVRAGQQLVEKGIRNTGFFASRHRRAPSLPSCPTPHEIPDSPPFASAVVDLLLGPLCFGTHRLDHASAGIALGRLWPHLVEADDYAALGRGGVEALEHPLLRANSGSTRAPNQVSSWRHFSPSASRTSLTRLRFMPMPFSPK